MEIQTHKRMRKAKFTENKVRVLLEGGQQSGSNKRRKAKCLGMMIAKIIVCGVSNHFPQQVSVTDKRKALNRAVLNHPDQLVTHILETTTTGEDLRVTRLTRNNGVNFRNGSSC